VLRALRTDGNRRIQAAMVETADRRVGRDQSGHIQIFAIWLAVMLELVGLSPEGGTASGSDSAARYRLIAKERNFY
jgi:hypothetical protein